MSGEGATRAEPIMLSDDDDSEAPLTREEKALQGRLLALGWADYHFKKVLSLPRFNTRAPASRRAVRQGAQPQDTRALAKALADSANRFLEANVVLPKGHPFWEPAPVEPLGAPSECRARAALFYCVRRGQQLLFGVGVWGLLKAW